MSGAGEAIPMDDCAAWNEALSGLPHAFGHTWDSCHAMQRTTGHPTFLFRYESGTAECVCPFSVRPHAGHEDIYTPYGFSGFTGRGDGGEMVDAWHRFVGSRNYVCGYVALNPLLAPGAFLALPECRMAGDLFFLDLANEPETLLQAMSPARRREIRRWQDHGGALVDDQEALAAYFCEHLVPFLRSRDAAQSYAFSPETLELLVASPATFLLGAGQADAIEAAMLFAHSPQIGEYLFVASASGAEHHAAPLLWAGGLELRARGARWLSLGGGVPQNAGVAEFKRRFGPVRRAMPVLEQVYDRRTFDILSGPHLRAGDGEPSYFPPYRRRSTHV